MLLTDTCIHQNIGSIIGPEGLLFMESVEKVTVNALRPSSDAKMQMIYTTFLPPPVSPV
jgi:hypothetical protein